MKIPILISINRLIQLCWFTYIHSRLLIRKQSKNPENSRLISFEYKKKWGKKLCSIFKAKIEWSGEGLSHLQEDLKSVLIISNHRSFVDIPAILSELNSSMLSKAEVENWGIVGPAAKSVGTIFVKRDNKSSRSASLEAISGALSEGKNVTIFAEGTTIGSPELGEYKPGTFKLAFEEGRKILPLHIEYSNKNFEWYGDISFQKSYFGYIGHQSTTIYIRVGKLLDPKDFIDAESLRDAARNFALDGIQASFKPNNQ